MEWLILSGGLLGSIVGVIIGLSVGLTIGFLLWHQHGSQEPLPERGDIVFIVPDDHAPVPYTLNLPPINDKEGNAIPIGLVVESSDSEVVAIAQNPDDAKAGEVSFGKPGNAAFTATEINTDTGKVVRVTGAQFHVTTGDVDPTTVVAGSATFGDLVEV